MLRRRGCYYPENCQTLHRVGSDLRWAFEIVAIVIEVQPTPYHQQ